jgi:hypothetical protein
VDAGALIEPKLRAEAQWPPATRASTNCAALDRPPPQVIGRCSQR